MAFIILKDVDAPDADLNDDCNCIYFNERNIDEFMMLLLKYRHRIETIRFDRPMQQEHQQQLIEIFLNHQSARADV